MKRFIVEKGKQSDWVLTDTENNVVITWTNKKFNDTQKVTLLDDTPTPDPTKWARVMREIGDYLSRYHREKCV